MALSGRISIRSKILLLLSSLVVAAVGLYLYLASKIFYEDKTLLIYELSQTQVRSLGTEVDVRIRRILDQLRIIAAAPGLVDVLIDEHPENEFIRVSWLEENAKKELVFDPIRTWYSSLKLYSRDAQEILQSLDHTLLPFDAIQKNKTWVQNSTLEGNASHPDVIPMVTVVLYLDSFKKAIMAELKLDSFLRAVSTPGITQSYLVDSSGAILAHPDLRKVYSRENTSSDVLLQAAQNSKVKSEVKRFEEGDHAYLGAYYRLGTANLTVASRVEIREAWVAMRVLIRKSLQYAAIVVTAAFLAALFFSHSLTTPIQRLVDATQRLAQGDFEQTVRVSTRDEISVLANSFNNMIHDLRVSRQKIEEYSKDLEKKVQDRTVQLERQNIAIKEAQEALLRTTRLASVGEIAGRAAHEVLNPLTSIHARLEKIQTQQMDPEGQDVQLFSEIMGAWKKDLDAGGEEAWIKALSVPSTAVPGKNLLQEDLVNLSSIAQDWQARFKTQKEDLQFLMREVARIEKIVSGMRQLSRSGESIKKIDVHSFLDNVFATMNDLLRKHQIRIEKNYASQSLSLSADHDELLQVFSNLLRNSMQAIDEAKRLGYPLGNPARVWISTELQKINQVDWVNIRICDNGPGIAEENFQRVFEPNFTTKKAEEGTGLGLSICRRFIRSWEGDIQVEKSEPGVETVFLIQLPLFDDKGRANG